MMATSQGAGGMPCLRAGSGPPLVMLPGLRSSYQEPRGMDRRFQARQMRPYAQARTVWWVAGGRPGLPVGTTMTDLAAGCAQVLREQLPLPVDVLANSTGGSIALQMAADHPDVVRRLVLVSAGYRLGPRGRQAQRDVARQLRAGRPRAAAAEMMGMIGARPAAQWAFGVLGWLLEPLLLGRHDPDMLTTIDAEDRFDLFDRLEQITAPTLVVAGDHDAFYSVDIFSETAELLPHGKLVLLPGKGHLAPFMRPVVAEVLPFLDTAADR